MALGSFGIQNAPRNTATPYGGFSVDYEDYNNPRVRAEQDRRDQENARRNTIVAQQSPAAELAPTPTPTMDRATLLRRQNMGLEKRGPSPQYASSKAGQARFGAVAPMAPIMVPAVGGGQVSLGTPTLADQNAGRSPRGPSRTPAAAKPANGGMKMSDSEYKRRRDMEGDAKKDLAAAEKAFVGLEQMVVDAQGNKVANPAYIRAQQQYADARQRVESSRSGLSGALERADTAPAAPVGITNVPGQQIIGTDGSQMPVSMYPGAPVMGAGVGLGGVASGGVPSQSVQSQPRWQPGDPIQQELPSYMSRDAFTGRITVDRNSPEYLANRRDMYQTARNGFVRQNEDVTKAINEGPANRGRLAALKAEDYVMSHGGGNATEANAIARGQAMTGDIPGLAQNFLLQDQMQREAVDRRREMGTLKQRIALADPNTLTQNQASLDAIDVRLGQMSPNVSPGAVSPVMGAALAGAPMAMPRTPAPAAPVAQAAPAPMGAPRQAVSPIGMDAPTTAPTTQPAAPLPTMTASGPVQQPVPTTQAYAPRGSALPFNQWFEQPGPATAPTSQPVAASPATQPAGGQHLTEQMAVEFIRRAGGDKNKAREMARAAGYAF